MEDVLREQNFMHDVNKSLREPFEKYINSTKKDFQFSMVHDTLLFHTQIFHSFTHFIKIQEEECTGEYYLF